MVRHLFLACAGLLLFIRALPATGQEITLRLDPEQRLLQIDQRLSIAEAGDPHFELEPWIEVVEARVDGLDGADSVGVEVARNGRALRLALPARRPLALTLRLRGQVPPLDSESAAVSGAQGAYLPGYVAWLPMPGGVSEGGAQKGRIRVEVPLPQRAVATGDLLADSDDGEFYRADFAFDAAGERPSLFAGPYEIAEQQAGPIRLRTYFYEALTPLAAGYLDTATGYLERYAGQIGPYPYRDFHIVAAPLPVGLGFRNLTYVGRRVLPLPFMRGRSLAHEVLHNWWGNGIAAAPGRGNWVEGLTSYQADYALTAEQGAEAAREMRLGWLRNFAALPPERDRPVTSFVGKSHDASQVVGYDKVAFIFHMLKRELGAEAFDAALAGFWQRHRFQTAGWADLQSAFEAAAGRDLAWFFAQWLRRGGAPRVELREAAVSNFGIGGGTNFRLRFSLRQSEPGYRLRLPLTVETAAGIEYHEVILGKPQQDFEITLSEPPLALHVDPDFETFRRLLPGESPPILRDVTLSEETGLLLVTTDAGLAESGRQLAARLLQRDAAPMESGTVPDGPLLIVGATVEIAAWRRDHGLGVAPLAAEGSARAWVERRPGGGAWMFVAADDAAALQALLRPLPHYRRHSYIVFDGARAGGKGLWPTPESPLRRRFGD